MTPRYYAAGAALVTAAVVLAGCSSSDDAGDKDAAPPSVVEGGPSEAVRDEEQMVAAVAEVTGDEPGSEEYAALEQSLPAIAEAVCTDLEAGFSVAEVSEVIGELMIDYWTPEVTGAVIVTVAEYDCPARVDATNDTSPGNVTD